MKTTLLVPVLALGIGISAPALPQSARIDDQGVFVISLRGLTAATLVFSGVQQNSRYAVNGELKSAGIVAWVRKISYVARARGHVEGQRYTPTTYSETADTGKRQSQSEITFMQGVPVKIDYQPARDPRPDSVDPATMGGAVDPLTALYATLRNVAPGEECKTNVQMFDGRRASRLLLSKPVRRGDHVVCTGEYRRLKGFSEKDMAEKSVFPFTLTYAPSDGGRMRVTEIALDTLYGQATMKRR
tara:strand:+ start:6420 stop:7151 length:732 start_codon:yes stop_codon:yes gene_type:complete